MKLKVEFSRTLPRRDQIGWEPTNSEPVRFDITPVDEEGFVVKANVNDLKHFVAVEWPNPDETESNYEIEQWSSGRF